MRNSFQNHKHAIFIVIFYIFSALVFSQKNVFSVKAKISKIYDGDSFQIKVLEKPHNGFKDIEEVRAVGIDSFEMKDNHVKNKCWAYYQRDYANFMLKNKTLYIECREMADGTPERDKYQRLLGIIKGNNLWIYQIQALSSGMIKGYYKFDFDQVYMLRFKAEQEIAIKAKRNLYADSTPAVFEENLEQSIGSVIRFVFRPGLLKQKRNYWYVYPEKGTKINLRIIIPKYALTDQKFLLLVETLKKETKPIITVEGFLGGSKKQMEITVYFKEQITMKNDVISN